MLQQVNSAPAGGTVSVPRSMIENAFNVGVGRSGERAVTPEKRSVTTASHEITWVEFGENAETSTWCEPLSTGSAMQYALVGRVLRSP